MELSDYVRIIRNRWWVIPLLMVLTAAAAFGLSRVQTPVYESSLRLLVNPSRTDFGQAQAARELLASRVQWLHSTYRAQAVINELQLDMTAPELLGDFNATSDNASYVIQIAVENTDPNLANDIVRTWGNLLIQWQTDRNAQQRLEDRIGIEFLDDPQVGLERPQTTINTVAGAILGLLLGIMVVFGLEWIESGVVRRTEDVERSLDIPVIGSIPRS
jgi:capsular polysaccharide biosynthesis protein